MEHTKHACMLAQSAGYEDELHPTANCWQRIRSRIRNLLLPCDWHYGTLVFLRSRKSLELERQRQIASGHWFIWHPYSPAKFYFDCFLWVMNAFVGLYAPLQVFFHCPNPANPLILATDFLTFCEIIVNFCSGYNDENNKEIVLEPRKIARNYIKGLFIVDLIAAVPWQLYQPFSDCRYPSHTVFYPTKLLRYRALLKIRESIMEQLEVPYFCTVIFTVIIRLVFFFNWMTYWQYQVPVICVHYYDLNNLGKAEAEWLNRLNVDPGVDAFTKYITNLYHVCARCIGAGYVFPVRNHVIPEMVQNCITEVISLIFLIYCFMTVLRLILCSQSNFIFDGAMKDLEKYMSVKRLPKSLQNKIRLFINYKFGGSYMDENYILNTINQHIKQDINMHTCRRLVVTVPLFKGFPIMLINTIIFRLKQEVFIPGQEVIKRGHLVESMYFIYYGTVVFIDEHGREIQHLNDGAHFGEAALLRPNEPAPTTVTALEMSEIYTLTNADFTACVQLYPQIQQRLTENHRRSVLRIFPGRR
ncbi:potassium/sodium hyperpolarization-activated cyclic nucleotide-gated channel 1-like [Cydia pomonella]|uniref:potassium/sodium hyperpolarization-activated cyclic nucleotide-gated channel 1-like n=1 Tax=Cydia pomonella TaxID=82600 RepID=UPI002ADE7352|nr:potassium/sodium hyperpolarization-activated cyclic nucleotide-gated channel 1-like [Cydia pomonella]